MTFEQVKNTFENGNGIAKTFLIGPKKDGWLTKNVELTPEGLVALTDHEGDKLIVTPESIIAMEIPSAEQAAKYIEAIETLKNAKAKGEEMGLGSMAGLASLLTGFAGRR